MQSIYIRYLCYDETDFPTLSSLTRPAAIKAARITATDSSVDGGLCARRDRDVVHDGARVAELVAMASEALWSCLEIAIGPGRLLPFQLGKVAIDPHAEDADSDALECCSTTRFGAEAGSD